ncbi:hypothetical protein LXL04_023509 [Taraxacum kok-saghyz]
MGPESTPKDTTIENLENIVTLTKNHLVPPSQEEQTQEKEQAEQPTQEETKQENIGRPSQIQNEEEDEE